MRYADDTNIYESFKPDQLNQRVQLINEDLNKVVEWSNNSNLVFNAGKTKTVLFGTKKMLKSRNLLSPSTYEIH